MVRSGFDGGEIVEELRRQWRARRGVVLPEVFAPDAAESLRARVEAAGFSPFYVADRGRYQVNTTLVDGLAFSSLRELAERIVEEKLTLASARWLRFCRGDYQLIRGDAVERALPGRHLELTLDLSARSTEQAEVVYTDGADQLVVPQWPNAVALVERRDTLYRYERYLNHLVGDAEVHRLRLSLRFA